MIAKTTFIVFKCIVKSAAKNASKLVGISDPVQGEMIDRVGDFVADCVDEGLSEYQHQTDEAKRRREFQDLAALAEKEGREAARLAIAEFNLPNMIGKMLEDRLANAPAVIRRTQRSPGDPSGRQFQESQRLQTFADLKAVMRLGRTHHKAGDRFMDYELEELLGVGGFAEVWKARNPHMRNQAPVALKFITNQEAQQRLAKHEINVLNKVQANGRIEGVIELRGTHITANPPCLIFEYVEGCDLSAVIRQRGETSWQEAAKSMKNLCEIVSRVHRLQIVHRDIKPANVMVRLDGSFALADFGIGGLAANDVAKRAKTGMGTIGTSGAVAGAFSQYYASPQQKGGKEADVRDDVYSLGVVWYQMLRGSLEVEAPTGTAWQNKLEAKGMSASMVKLLGSMIEHEREDRPPNVLEVFQKIVIPNKQTWFAYFWGSKSIWPTIFSGVGPPAAIPVTKAAPANTSIPIAKPAVSTVAETTPVVPPPSVPRHALTTKAVPPLAGKNPQQVTNSIGMKFALIPAGKFMMGATKELNPNADSDESPRHEVTLTKDFYLGIYQVTQEEWERVKGATPILHLKPTLEDYFTPWKMLDQKRVMGKNPSYFKGARRPVERVSWHEAMVFCKRLSELPAEKAKGHFYRLPTEAEWEYACRGGVSKFSIYHFGNTITKENANFGNNFGETTEVGKYAPNAFGLYDMHGNVSEWCLDGPRKYQNRAETDPRGPEKENDIRVVRGGGYNSDSLYCAASYRRKLGQGYWRTSVGFRLCRVSVGE